VVVLVAAAIVITIVGWPADRRRRRGRPCEGVEAVRAQTDALAGNRADQRLRVRILHAARALRRWRWANDAARVTNNDMWGDRAGIGLVAALIVAGLLVVLVRAVADIGRPRARAPRRRGQGGDEHRPHLAAAGHGAGPRADRLRGRRPQTAT
jgi:hypothetical protein